MKPPLPLVPSMAPCHGVAFPVTPPFCIACAHGPVLGWTAAVGAAPDPTFAAGDAAPGPGVAGIATAFAGRPIGLVGTVGA